MLKTKQQEVLVENDNENMSINEALYGKADYSIWMFISLMSERKLNALIPYDLALDWLEHYNYNEEWTHNECCHYMEKILQEKFNEKKLRTYHTPLFRSFIVCMPYKKKYISIVEKCGFSIIPTVNASTLTETITNLADNFKKPKNIDFLDDAQQNG